MSDERKGKNIRTLRTFPILRDLAVLCGFHFF